MKKVKKRKGPGFPWLLFLLLAGTIYLFWILPARQGPRPVEVTFERGSEGR
ncbi:hypothetical protein BH11ARM2_BH11ARM2_25290 [soil metagenome]